MLCTNASYGGPLLRKLIKFTFNFIFGIHCVKSVHRMNNANHTYVMVSGCL
jgi:hypothetical protein